MKTKNSSADLMRADIKFKRFLDDCSVKRIKNDIDKKKRSYKELTSMMINCPSFQKVRDELTSIPKKEDMKDFIWRK